MITLPAELQQLIRTLQGEPLRLADPETKSEYVLLRAEVFDQLREYVYDDGPLSDDERRRLLIQAGLRAGWDDPEMDVYDDLDPRKHQ